MCDAIKYPFALIAHDTDGYDLSSFFLFWKSKGFEVVSPFRPTKLAINENGYFSSLAEELSNSGVSSFSIWKDKLELEVVITRTTHHYFENYGIEHFRDNAYLYLSDMFELRFSEAIKREKADGLVVDISRYGGVSCWIDVFGGISSVDDYRNLYFRMDDFDILCFSSRTLELAPDFFRNLFRRKKGYWELP